MWYVPLYQDAAKQSVIVQVMPAMARPQLPTTTTVSGATAQTRPAAFRAPSGDVRWPMGPKPPQQPWAPPPGYRSWSQHVAPAEPHAQMVIPALNTVVALPVTYRYTAAKAVAYVTQKIGWKFVKQAASVPMALAQIGMPWAPQTATALSLLKRMCDDVSAIDITINPKTHTITYDAKL